MHNGASDNSTPIWDGGAPSTEDFHALSMDAHQETRSSTHTSTSQALLPLAHVETSSAHKDLVQELLREPIVREAFDRLYNALPSDLYYHNVQHTLDVFEHALLLGRHGGLDTRDLKLLAIAAAWHDTGFIEMRHQNEPIAALWAQDAMERAGTFSRTDIADVRAAILDTEMKLETETGIRIQRAAGRISPWLLDADLSNFGRRSFFDSMLKLFREIHRREITSADELYRSQEAEFLKGTLQMLKRHHWQTDAGYQLLQGQKENNIAKLKKLIDSEPQNSPEHHREAWAALTAVE